MNKKIRLAALLLVLLCLSGCGNKNNAATSDADSVEEVTNEQSGEISDTVASPEPVEEESAKTDESINADDETVDGDNETPEQNEVESTDETKLEESVIRTECNETVYTNTTSNIRLQPSSSAEKVETVSKGTELLRTGILDNGWSEIQYNGQTCYISSKLVDPENTVIETAAANSNESVSADTNANESTLAATIQAGNGETKTFSNGVTFVCQGYTPNGLKIWCASWDTEGSWPDYMIAAYDATGITNDMSDYDKAVAINNYICRVVDYAYENGVDDRAAYCACLSYGKAICTGYAHAFDCLCTMAGVYSNQVTGIAGGASHSWDYVLIGDTKYWVDPTLNDSNNNAYLMSTSQFSDHVFGYEK